MSIMLHGVGVAKGLAIGKAHVVQHDALDVIEYALPLHLVEDEVARLRHALALAKQQLKDIRAQIPKTTAVDVAAFIDTHLLMLDDSALAEASISLIVNRQCNAEWALKTQRDLLTRVFEEMNDPYLRTRKDDVDYVVNRVLRILLNQSTRPFDAEGDQHLAGAIVFAEDLSPADTLLMQQRGVAGFVTESGGLTSHTTILARSLGLPAITGVHCGRHYVQQDEIVFIDGHYGLILVDADDVALQLFRARQLEERRHVAALHKLRSRPATSVDDVRISLQANVELPEDLSAVRRAAAEGIGLYRTEFLFLNRSDLPGEEEQYETYLGVVQAMRAAPVTFRTLDLGADKPLPGVTQHNTGHAALGVRGIRLCLKEPLLFRPQLRALLRVAVHGPVRIMFPMLSTLHELRQVLAILDDVKRALTREGVAFNPQAKIGGMIEVPAAALIADSLAQHLDFLSIGTNDLIQYTLAADRINDAVTYLCDPLHPAVLRLIDFTLRSGRRAHIPVSMCGEMAGDIRYTRLLLGLGLREFSMHPTAVLEVKRVIQLSHVAVLTRITRQLLQNQDHAAIVAQVEKFSDMPL